jgi:hypothetical protein
MTLKEYLESALMITVIGVLHVVQKIKELLQKP